MQVSGGQANLAPRVRDTDAAGVGALLPRPLGRASTTWSRRPSPATARARCWPTVNVQTRRRRSPMYLVPVGQHGHDPPHRRRLEQARPAPGAGRHLRRLAEHQRARHAPTSPAWPPATTWPTSPPASRAATRPGAPARSSRPSAASSGPTRSREPPPPPARRRRQAGFTLIELLMGIVLASVFALALYGFFFAGLDAAARHAVAGDRPVDRPHGDRPACRRDIRQSISPDDGLTSPRDRAEPDQPRDLRRPVALDRRPRPPARRRCATRSSPTSSSARRADPIGVTAPFTLRRLRPPRGPHRQGAERRDPGLRAPSPTRAPRSPPTPTPHAAAGHRPGLRPAHRSSQKTGNAATTLELNTDVALRNAIRL